MSYIILNRGPFLVRLVPGLLTHGKPCLWLKLWVNGVYCDRRVCPVNSDATSLRASATRLIQGWLIDCERLVEKMDA